MPSRLLAVALVLGLAPAAPAADEPAKELTAKELDSLWARLAGDDAKEAYQAIVKLSRHPKQGVPLCKERLKPAPAVDAKKVEALVKDLESDKAETADAAAAELEKLGELAEPALRKRLGEKPPEAVAKRIEGLLAKLGGPVAPGEQLRALRAIEVLESIGSPEAADVLKALAGGAPGARVTVEAKASLDRLQRRKEK